MAPRSVSSYRGKFFLIFLLCLITAASLFAPVLAAEPGNSITGRYAVTSEETWTQSHNITGMVANSNNNKLTIKGSTLTTNSSFSAAFGSSYAFGNWGTLTLDKVTINNQSGEHRIVAVLQDGELNVINGSVINFNNSNSNVTGQAMFRVAEGRKANFSNVKMNGNVSSYYNGTYFHVEKDGSVFFSGTNTLDKLYGSFYNNGTFKIQNKAAEGSNPDLTTISNSTIYQYGDIIVDEGANLTLDSVKLYMNYYNNASSAIIVKKGATLTINGNSSLYLNQNGSTKSPIQVEEGGKVVVENSTLSQYSYRPYTTVINSDGGTVELKNVGASYAYLSGKDGSIVHAVNKSTVTIDGGTYNYSYAKDGGVVNVDNSKVTLKGSVNFNSNYTSGSSDGKGGVIYAVNESEVIVEGGTYSSNRAYNGGVIYVEDSKLSITGGNFRSNYVSSGTATKGGVVSSINSEVKISDGQFSSNNNNWYSFIGGVLYAKGGSVTVDGETVAFSNNYAMDGGVFYIEGDTKLSITGGSFTNNRASNFGGVVYAASTETKYRSKDGEETDPTESSNQPSVTINGGTYQNNSAKAGGAIRIMGGTLTVDEDAQFTRNSATNADAGSWTDWVGGGAIFATDSTLYVVTGTFENNSANLIGGAIVLEGGNMELGSQENAQKKPVFKGNTADVDSDRYTAARGGAIAADIYCDGTSFDTCNAAAVLADIVIHNAEFDSNKSRFQAGAIAIGYGPQTGYRRRAKTEVTVEIHRGIFTNNEVTANHNQGMAGGAIMIQQNGSLSMKDALITGNSTNAAGGGIASCATGQTLVGEDILHHAMAEGSAVFGNTASVPPSTMQDIYIFDNSRPHPIGELMFNGGTHHWTKDETVKRNGRRDGESVELTGSYYGSAPENEPTEAQAMIVFKGNKATGTEWTDPKASNGNGGAIANNGILVMGTYSTEIDITKTWQDDSNKLGQRPDAATLIAALELTGHAEAQQLTDVKEVNCTDDVDRGVSCYTAYWKPYNLDVQVTGFNKDNNVNEDEWTIKILGLPKNVFDNDTDQVTPITWTLSEVIPTFTDEDGEEYNLYVEDPNNIEKVDDTHFNITNELNFVEIPVKKIWKGEDDQDDRPAQIIVHLLADGYPVRRIEVPEYGKEDESLDADEWTFTFTKLPKYDEEGREIKYTIDEEWIPNYSETIDDVKYVITNEHTPNKRDIKVTKRWEDDDNRDGLRSALEFALYLSGRELPIATFRLPLTYTEGAQAAACGQNPGALSTINCLQTSDISFQFKDLDMYCGEDQHKCSYIVREETKIEGYESSIGTIEIDGVPVETNANTGYIFVNTHNPETTEITVTKTWVDEGADHRTSAADLLSKLVLKAGEKTYELKNITLKADSVSTYTADASAGKVTIEVAENDNIWTIKYSGLPLNDLESHKEISWSVEEMEIPHYVAAVGTDGLTITNTMNLKSIELTKVWDDGGQVDSRPTPLELVQSISLYANVISDETYLTHGEIRQRSQEGNTYTFGIETHPLLEVVLTTGDNEWKATIYNLPKYNSDGSEINYFVDENLDESFGYTKTVEGLTITNYKENPTPTTSIRVMKVWEGDGEDESTRPESVAITLQPVGTRVELTAPDWTYTFEDLPIYNEAGEEIHYRVIEDRIDHYDSSNSGVPVDGVITITNTYNPEPPTPHTPFFFRLDELPKTGFSSVRPTVLSAQPKEISYKPENLVLQIPSLDVKADIVTIPFVDGEYPVEWLGMQAGLLEGSAKPGEGMMILTGHNTLNTMEVGPFAFLSFMQEGDMIFLLNKYNQLKPYSVYAVEKIGATDSAALERIASMDANSLTMLTCEDELPEGGYASRRVVAAKPVGTW